MEIYSIRTRAHVGLCARYWYQRVNHLYLDLYKHSEWCRNTALIASFLPTQSDESKLSFAALAEDKNLRIYTLDTSADTISYQDLANTKVLCSGDGNVFLTCLLGHHLRVWQLCIRNGAELSNLLDEWYVHHLCFSHGFWCIKGKLERQKFELPNSDNKSRGSRLESVSATAVREFMTMRCAIDASGI